MKKEDFIIMLRDILQDFYVVYRSVGSDPGFRLFYQYIIDAANNIERGRK